MSWFQEVRPSFLVSRLYGLAPHSFVNDLLSTSRTIRIYSFVIFLIRFCEGFFRIYMHVTLNSSLQLKILKVFRTLLTTSAHVTAGICSVRSKHDLNHLINDINEYDKALGIKFVTKSIAQRTWLILGFIAFYLITLWSLRPAEIMGRSKLYNIYYAIRGIGWFCMPFKFLSIVFSFKRRFQYLSNILTKGAPFVVNKSNSANAMERFIRLRDVGHLHNKLITAARKFNSMHNIVLVMLICESSLTVTLEIYYYLNNDASPTYAKLWQSVISILPDLVLLTCVFTVSHNTAVIANRIGWIALSPTSYVFRGCFVIEKDDIFVIGQRFILDSFNFQAGYGLFSIELPFLGTIFAAMTTVLAVLCG